MLQLRSKVDVPVVLVSKEERIAVGGGNEHASEMLSSPSNFDPVVVTVHPNFPIDREVATGILREVFVRHDVAEPFKRVATALEQVHAQKVGEAQG